MSKIIIIIWWNYYFINQCLSHYGHFWVVSFPHCRNMYWFYILWLSCVGKLCGYFVYSDTTWQWPSTFLVHNVGFLFCSLCFLPLCMSLSIDMLLCGWSSLFKASLIQGVSMFIPYFASHNQPFGVLFWIHSLFPTGLCLVSNGCCGPCSLFGSTTFESTVIGFQSSFCLCEACGCYISPKVLSIFIKNKINCLLCRLDCRVVDQLFCMEM